MSKDRISYSGKDVYVGIDVHQKTYVVTVNVERQIVKRATLQALPNNLIHFLQKHFEGAQIFSAYEAGFFGFGLHRALIAERHYDAS